MNAVYVFIGAFIVAVLLVGTYAANHAPEGYEDEKDGFHYGKPK
jgi:hypothetical protein